MSFKYKMKPIKKSSSGLLLYKNINLFKKGPSGNGSSIAYNKNQEKANRLEFELEKQKDIIIKLQLELNEKEEEFNKILNKNKKRKNKFQKTIKLIEQVLKICDKNNKNNEKEIELESKNENENENELKDKTETNFYLSLYNEQSKPNFKSINVESETDNYNKTNTNMKTFYTTNNNYNKKEKSLPKIKSPKNKLTINTNYNFNSKKRFKDLLYMTTLRNQIDNLNDKIEKKDIEIIKLKCTNNVSSYSKLQTDFISNYNKLTEIKNKNILMVSKLDDITENYFILKDENYNLKIRLEEFQEQFYEYKITITKKIIDLENKLKIYKEKNKDCFFNHFNKALLKKNKSFLDDNKSKLIEAENIIEHIIKEIKQIETEINNKNDIITSIKKEIENLNKEKNKLNNKNTEGGISINNLNKEKISLNEIYKELGKENNELKNKLKDNEIKYINEIYKVKEVKDNIDKKNNEIEQLKKEIEILKNSKKKKFFFDE